MNKIKVKDKFFCLAPWKSFYLHIDNSSPCHIIKRGFDGNVKDYVESEWLTNLKETFTNEEVPNSCIPCKRREEQGVKSTRGATWNYFNYGPEVELDISGYLSTSKSTIKRVEVRFSNLCNFKCRMCDANSSSSIAKENLEVYKKAYLPTKNHNNGLTKSSDIYIEEVKQLFLNHNVEKLCLTGGEPFLIKEYYDLLQFLIDNNFNETVIVELFTNCSTYNTNFLQLLNRFKTVSFVMSIDGVNKTAEYQRHGTKWDVVKENIIKFNSSKYKMQFNTVLSIYSLLDVSSLSKFLMDLYHQNNDIQTRCYTVPLNTPLHYSNADERLRSVILDEIDKSLDILTVDNFKIFHTELYNIKKYILSNKPIDIISFKNETLRLDKIRNESFEECFNIKLNG